jgi:hypothetical protein
MPTFSPELPHIARKSRNIAVTGPTGHDFCIRATISLLADENYFSRLLDASPIATTSKLEVGKWVNWN